MPPSQSNPPEEEGDTALTDQPHHRGRLHLLPQLQVDPQHLRAEAIREVGAGVRLARLDP